MSIRFLNHNKPILRVIFAGLVLGLLFFLAGIKIVSPTEYPNSDFFSFWFAGYASLTGSDPYSESFWVTGHDLFGATWVSDSTFLYPLPLAVLLTPLALVPLKWAFIAWVALSLAMFLLSALLLLGLNEPLQAKPYLIPILIALPLFRPIAASLVGGQLSAFLLLILTAAVYLMQKEFWILGGATLALLALKPGIGVPLIVFIGGWGLITRNRPFWVGLVGSGLALGVIGWIWDIQWVSKFLAIGDGKLASTFGYSPTVWGAAGKICDQTYPCTLQVGGVFALMVMILAALMLWRGRKKMSAFGVASLGVPAVLLLTPYLWPYDQSLLLLPLIFVVAYFRNHAPYLVPAALFLIVDILALLLLFQASLIGHEAWNAGLTCIVLALVAASFSQFSEQQEHTQKPQPAQL